MKPRGRPRTQPAACTFTGCTRGPCKSHGLCLSHYTQLCRTGVLRPLQVKSTTGLQYDGAMRALLKAISRKAADRGIPSAELACQLRRAVEAL